MDINYSLPNLTSTLQIIGCHVGNFHPNWSFPRHHHYLFELLHCKHGEIRQTIGDHVFTFSSGSWLLIKSGISHASENGPTSDYSFFNLHFDLDDPIIRERLCKADYVIIKEEEAAGLSLPTHFGAIENAILHNNRIDTVDGDKALNRLIIQSHTLGIISEFIKYSEEAPSPIPMSDDNMQNASVFETELAHAIEEKLRNGNNGRIAEIAASLGISRGRCTHIFTKVYGQSPRQYMSKIVLNQAKHLLVHSTYSMEELAEQLGFQSASHFSRQFRRWTGMPPSAFRPKFVRSHRNEDG
ncbi:helix-turn-helix transcriptional regulator [Paenibacillus sp. LHD-38]|uniref:helix-turn-helix transcriptional regulator n=1 Tax=Paenibacillus sp. LHD-38 TaxID=3072143 RepID=UPI00280C3ECC|nr:helix-turn-helix transcriptional regulator [Paenibacillus sp. LHD-38]MDQ8737106.1 helix-turn-helix transcriptional regulator [Paenibacillus sp. LHD-38]